ncbi:MAG: hypothetical protein IPL10_07585 [Bacteroidetes bacterium]|nr:hypothetical protein [Bacteroidota bacterium]
MVYIWILPFFIRKTAKISYATCLFSSCICNFSYQTIYLFALLPGSILWLSNNAVKKINHGFIRIIATPIILSLGGIAGYVALDQMGDNLGQYKLDTVLDKAVVTQKDMKADYYGGKLMILVNLTLVLVVLYPKHRSPFFLVFLDLLYGM